MPYGTGLKLLNVFGVRTSRTSVQNEYASRSYRTATNVSSSSLSSRSTSLSRFAKGKNDGGVIVIDDPNGNVAQQSAGGTTPTSIASSGISALVEDTTPQLGGNLDLNNRQIVSGTSGTTIVTGANIVQVASNLVELTSAGDTMGTKIDRTMWPLTHGAVNQVMSVKDRLTHCVDAAGDIYPYSTQAECEAASYVWETYASTLKWADAPATASSGGGMDFATFTVNSSGELVVDYLGDDIDASDFTINSNGEMEVNL